jgi:hypothetical protein
MCLWNCRARRMDLIAHPTLDVKEYIPTGPRQSFIRAIADDVSLRSRNPTPIPSWRDNHLERPWFRPPVPGAGRRKGECRLATAGHCGAGSRKPPSVEQGMFSGILRARCGSWVMSLEVAAASRNCAPISAGPNFSLEEGYAPGCAHFDRLVTSNRETNSGFRRKAKRPQ